MGRTLAVFSVPLWSIVLCLAFIVATCPPAISAQEAVAKLDPANSTIKFTLGATFHTVHGTFKMKDGEIRFDPASGISRPMFAAHWIGCVKCCGRIRL